MNVATVMQQIADRVGSLPGLDGFGFPPDTVTPDAAIASYPESIDFDITYTRGADRITLPLVLVVGKVSDRSTRDSIGAYCDGSGDRSIKQVIESGSYTAFDYVVVKRVEFDTVMIARVDYLAAMFTLDVVGPGSS